MYEELQFQKLPKQLDEKRENPNKFKNENLEMWNRKHSAEKRSEKLRRLDKTKEGRLNRLKANYSEGGA